MFANAQSIVSKIDLLQTDVSEWKPYFVGIVESFCTDDHSDAYLALEGYELVGRRDGNTTTRGIARGSCSGARGGYRPGWWRWREERR